MHLGMPVVALATTEAVEAVPPAAGACSNRMDVLTGAVRRLLSDPDQAAEAGGWPGRPRSPATAWTASCTTGTDFSRR
jgi:hypothetical protein